MEVLVVVVILLGVLLVLVAQMVGTELPQLVVLVLVKELLQHFQFLEHRLFILEVAVVVLALELVVLAVLVAVAMVLVIVLGREHQVLPT
jgi:hypothetical protein